MISFKEELLNEEVLDFEDALYQSGFEWDYENEKKKIYKIYLDDLTIEDFISQMKRLGRIKYNNEKLLLGNTYGKPQDAKKVIEGK